MGRKHCPVPSPWGRAREGVRQSSRLRQCNQLLHQRHLLRTRHPAHAGCQRSRHVVVVVGAVFDPQCMSVFVQQYGEHVHFAVGGSALFRYPFVRVGGGEEFAVVPGVVSMNQLWPAALVSRVMPLALVRPMALPSRSAKVTVMEPMS